MDELSPEELELAAELPRLASDPSPEARESIMSAVRTSNRSRVRTAHFPLGSRLTASVLVAAVFVLVTTVLAFAASSTALPDSPAYGVRSVGEHIRIAILAGSDRDLLRIAFARQHFRQAQEVVHRDRPGASQLLKDGRVYLDEARRDLQSLPAGEQGQVENQLNQAGEEQSQTENQVGQQGEQ